MLRDKVGVKINSQGALFELVQCNLLLPALTANGPGIHWLMRLDLFIFPGEEEQRTPFPMAQVLDVADVERMIASRVNVDNSGNDMGDAAVEQGSISIQPRKPVDLQSLNWAPTEVAAVLLLRCREHINPVASSNMEMRIHPGSIVERNQHQGWVE